MDACAEGLRKFTTEVFDTGIALLGYAALLLWYDWRLALLCSIFPSFSYLIADKMKAVVQRTGAEYKESAGRLSAAVLDRVSGAVTYRVYGCEEQRNREYETHLIDYEKLSVKSSKAAKLFNSVQKAQVSWFRIRPLFHRLPFIRSIWAFGIRREHFCLTLFLLPQNRERSLLSQAPWPAEKPLSERPFSANGNTSALSGSAVKS